MTNIPHISHDEAVLQQRLHAIFFDLWRFGSNALVGWRPSSRGIEVITLPKVRLFADHGRHLPVFSEASEVGPGRYEAALEFTMGGDWVILFQINLPDGRNLQRQIDVKGVRPG